MTDTEAFASMLEAVEAGELEVKHFTVEEEWDE